MRVTLYANVSANGHVLLSENSNHQVPSEIIGMAINDINKAGNLVMGRKSYENFVKAFGGVAKIREVLPNVELIWLSTTSKSTNDYKVFSSTHKVIDYLRSKDFEQALIGGGTDTYNAFLDSNLISEAVFNIVPVITTGGILGANPINLKLTLVKHELLSGNVMQLTYRSLLS
jgi:dihydrofolate reductase